ncbi:MAG: CPBP family intramembrane glutamic endopeptidase [bacterium]
MKIIQALLLGIAIAVLALLLSRLTPLSSTSFPPSSFVTHTVMAVASVLLAWHFSKGNLAEYGFTRGSFRLNAGIFLWVIPTGCLSVLRFVGMGAEETKLSTLIHDVLFVWIYASICEEILTRGLLQSFLSPLRDRRVRILWRWQVSIPVCFSALFFGAMHIVLITRLGPAAIVPMLLATGLGFVAGYYREKSGSLIPAIIIHALFNVGGMLPFWILSALFG